MEGAVHGIDRGRRDPGHPGEPACPLPPGEKYGAEPGGHPVSGGAGIGEQKAREIITGYDGVTVTALPENPTVCLVEFAFTVAHGLNQIWLTASITI